MPDRDYYLAERFKPQRDGYREYVGLVLKEAWWGDAEASAERVGGAPDGDGGGSLGAGRQSGWGQDVQPDDGGGASGDRAEV